MSSALPLLKTIAVVSEVSLLAGINSLGRSDISELQVNLGIVPDNLSHLLITHVLKDKSKA